MPTEPLLKRALAINEKALGPDHPRVANTLNNFAWLYKDQGRYADAQSHVRRSSAIYSARTLKAGAVRSSGALSEQTSVRHIFFNHVDIATGAINQLPEQRDALLAEAFLAGQSAQATGTAAAVARMGARFAAGDDALSHAVRERQDAVERWRRVDTSLVKAVSETPLSRDATAEEALRSELEALDQQILDLDAQLAREFPSYAELASPTPVSLADTQRLLGPAEALITYVVGFNTTFLWVVRRDRATIHLIDIGRKELDDTVVQLRSGLDPTGISRLADIPAFDTALAYALYSKLWAPAEPLLDDADLIFVVPDAGLQSLPLGVLVTEQPTEQPKKGTSPVTGGCRGWPETTPWPCCRRSRRSRRSGRCALSLRRRRRPSRSRGSVILCSPAIPG
jgi:hypothetical protein